MSGKLQRRLVKIEAHLAEKQRHVDLANCSCKSVLIVNGDSEAAEARETLRSHPCLAHGLDHQTRLIIIESIACEREPEIVSTVGL